MQGRRRPGIRCRWVVDVEGTWMVQAQPSQIIIGSRHSLANTALYRASWLPSLFFRSSTCHNARPDLVPCPLAD